MTLLSDSPLLVLRKQAERIVQAKADPPVPDIKNLSMDAMRQTLHELQVHQIELEMQNDQLRQTQLELDAARARYFDLYDLAPVGYCTVSERGLIQETNFTAAALLNLVRSDMVRKPVSRFIVQADQDVYYQCCKTLLDTGQPQDCELRMSRRGDAPFWVQLKVSVAQDTTGCTVQRMVLSDISESRRLAAVLEDNNHALEVARATAERASLAKSDFLSNMTHELRSPLNSILGFAQLLEIGSPLPTATQKSNIDQILRAGWYLLDLIGEILDLTSTETGKMTLSMQPVRVMELLQDCKTGVALDAHQKNIRVHIAPTDQALVVDADPSRLKQVMVHLLTNAIQYNHAGGTVELTCIRQDNQRVRIAVRDTGDGLTPEAMAHLFQPFNRLGRATGTQTGVGVGLALSKRLMELMGGSIGADSTIGVGSAFWVEVKLSGSTAKGAP